jgi:Xaa-Pro aminopeptidase
MEICSKRKQLEVQKEWLLKRLDTLLPKFMKETGIDMWLVACREYNEDPVFNSLMPPKNVSARRFSILLFSLKDGKVERTHAFNYDIGSFYKGIAEKGEEALKAALRYIESRNPEKIGINVSENFAFGDGLSKGLYDQINAAFPEELKQKFCSAENLCIRWLETRIDEEMVIYHKVNQLAHDIIAKAFSSEQVCPGKTTSQDLEWFILESINEKGLKYWFPADVYIHRNGEMTSGVIEQGDILHCDVGLEYFGLQSDTQRLAYCLKEGETEASEGLKAAFKKGLEFQNIVCSKFKEGKTGNQIFSASVTEAKSKGFDVMLYTHPIGIHGHGAGPTIGLFDNQNEIPVRGDLKLHKNTCYALELNIKEKIPEWDNRKQGIYLEQTVGFDGEQIIFFDDRQREFIVI